MKTIALFIQNAKLKMNVIRILMKNDFYYIEASTREELLIKLSLCKNACLLIMDFNKDQLESDFFTLVQTDLQQIPILLVIPDEYSYILPGKVRKQITDIILTPFKPNTLLRKIKAIINIQGHRDKLKVKATQVPRQDDSQNHKILTALEAAANNKYPICIFRIFVPGAFMELNLQLLDKLQNILRQSDEVIEIDLGEFIVLCPYTPFESLDIAKTKIMNAILPIVQADLPNRDIEISGFNYPDEFRAYKEIISILDKKSS